MFCNISLSYLFACFDFWSSVRRKTAKTLSPVSYKYRLSLGNRVWGFPHMAQASTLTEVYLKKYNLHEVLYLNFSGINERDLKEE